MYYGMKLKIVRIDIASDSNDGLSAVYHNWQHTNRAIASMTELNPPSLNIRVTEGVHDPANGVA